MNTITWAGVPSDTLSCNITIERYPELSRPARKMDVYSVPGRNGDLILPQDAWENYIQKYEIYAGDGLKGSGPEAFREIAAWLYAPSGYQKLIDTYEPEYYRLAYYQGGLDVANTLSRFGRATIEFNCRPERFLAAGERELVLTPDYSSFNWLTLNNPTAFASRPVFRLVYVSGGESTDCLVRLQAAARNNAAEYWGIWIDHTCPSVTMYIDSQSLNCYDSSGNNLNRYVSFWDSTGTVHKFPEVPSGLSYLNARYADEEDPNTSITEVGITPNWWTL